jgi:hypothetical protein
VGERKMNQALMAAILLLVLQSTQLRADEVLQFLGQATPVAMGDVLTDEQINQLGVDPADYTCFQMPMLDPATGDQIGLGTDCLIFNDIPGRVVSQRGLQRGRAFQNLAGDVAVNAISVFSFTLSGPTLQGPFQRQAKTDSCSRQGQGPDDQEMLESQARSLSMTMASSSIVSGCMKPD